MTESWRPMLVRSALALAVLQPWPAQAQQPRLPTIVERTAGLDRHDGFLPFYYDEGTGRLLLEVARPGEEFLYYVSLATGAVWPAGRGYLPWQGGPGVVRFERHGPRLLLVRSNPRFRARDPDDIALDGVAQASFPFAVVATLTIVAEESGRVLVDATDLLVRDAFEIAESFRRAGRGNYRFDRDRSAVHMPGSGGFPRNTELEATLTFTGGEPDLHLGRHAADPGSISLRARHTLAELPAPGYRPRRHDPRMGFNPMRVHDFSGRLDEGYQRAWITRWRLEKEDSSAPLSEPVRPIVFYLEPGIPEPYRTAFRDGLLYWNRVFEAAGFRNAVRVEDLPAGVHPLDHRYPIVVVWALNTMVTSSMGQSIADPRTGELIKAIVLMDSHRSLVDFNTHSAWRPALGDGQPDAESFAMTRRRWHVAHEAAHVLARLAHNLITPSQVGFPAPDLRIGDDGRLEIDLSSVEPAEPWPYDRWVVRYAYTPFGSPEEEAGALDAIVEDGLRQGLRYVSDFPARSIPLATGRLHGDDLFAELDRVMAVRRVLLDRFDESAVRPGEPMALLFERLVPVYFHHRPVLQALVKAVGGVDYRYGVRGDGQPHPETLDPDLQRRALDRLLAVIEPAGLAIPGRVADIIPPRPGTLSPAELEWDRGDRSRFGFMTGDAGLIDIPTPAGGIFDPLGWAAALAGMVLDPLFDRSGAARLVTLHARDPANPSLDEVLATVVARTWHAPTPADAGDAALAGVVRRAVLDRLLALAGDERATPAVRAAAIGQLHALADRIDPATASTAAERGLRLQARRDIRRFLEGA